MPGLNMETDLTPSPPPLARPTFTLKDLHDAIPPHCFKRSLIRSLGHLTVNVVICIFLFYCASHIVTIAAMSTLVPPLLVSILLWPIYWFLQGVYFLGLWVMAHEAGHGAFSNYYWLDDTLGYILHSFLLVPFQSWRSSHRHHHRISGNCDDDQVFLPPTRSKVESAIVEMLEECPIYNTLTLILMLTMGVMPAYLFANFSGPSKYPPKSNLNSFSPSSVLFLPKQRNDILLATFGVLTAFNGLFLVAMETGVMEIIFYYGVPYVICNCFVVLITFLHHTDTYIPRFREPEWNWMRGALCTVDRSFGPWLDGAFHHISDTHVCHHLFPRMPFYHAVEATKAMSKVLGRYHLKDDTPIFRALCRAYRNCKFVEDEGTILFYKRNLRRKFKIMTKNPKIENHKGGDSS